MLGDIQIQSNGDIDAGVTYGIRAGWAKRRAAIEALILINVVYQTTDNFIGH